MEINLKRRKALSWTVARAASRQWRNRRMDSKETILRIARVAEAVGWQAGVGGCETAGAIVSYLAANPDQIDTFLKDGLLAALEAGDARDMHLNGRLTWHRRNGDVVSPANMRAVKAAKA